MLDKELLGEESSVRILSLRGISSAKSIVLQLNVSESFRSFVAPRIRVEFDEILLSM